MYESSGGDFLTRQVLDEDLQNGWDQAKQCLTVLLQSGRNGILTIQHLKTTPDSWIGLSDLRRRHCEI